MSKKYIRMIFSYEKYIFNTIVELRFILDKSCFHFTMLDCFVKRITLILKTKDWIVDFYSQNILIGIGNLRKYNIEISKEKKYNIEVSKENKKLME